ncbi:trimeric intracellular cation channel family protein [Nocardioides jishulii]|uniref:Trimeric intracellular cation channel family protein n=1 Tax=Nocardioides jishulii TaxID=2575440 RepID=A0A4U2YLW0_9ACTN|nr:TRIC cation channel family protein [Nocardioides jishulii]QCX27403.1 trimeric intracellular cation channel family protein [Nocardioides jishulii]TKI62209.1 trimeric intracellular cation channel family protein [Nocardioides jishulii]
MDTTTPLFLALDLTGVFAFALNGALVALKVTRIDVVGVVTLAMFTALGGGMVRDILLGAVPPATFVDWRYLTVAAAGGVAASLFAGGLEHLARPILVLDAAGLSLFAVTGALKGLDFGMGVAQATILGTITAVGGGTLRDVLVREVPSVLSSGLYAVPAMLGALILAGGVTLGVAALPAALTGAIVCFVVRMLGVRYNLHAPLPRSVRRAARRR